MEKNLVYNAIKTPDGTILHSKHRHDFVSHLDANGETYYVDGGNDYIRRSVNTVEAENISLYDDEPFKVIREHIFRGSYGKNGDEPLHYVRICDMSDDYIESIFDYGASGWFLDLLKKEKEFRKL